MTSANDPATVLGRGYEFWERLRGASLFLTGATGFFGMWLLESFAEANDRFGLGARALVLTRNAEGFARKNPGLARRNDIELLQGDVRNFAFPPRKFQLLMHGASPGVTQVQVPDVVETLAAGTRRVIDFACDSGVEEFLLVSSGAVYGPHDEPYVAEDAAWIETTSPYARGKRVAEEILGKHVGRASFRVKIARCFTFVGPHLPLDGPFAIGNFIRDGLARTPIAVRGDGSAIRSYLYAGDLAAWLWAILFCGSNYRAYNVGSEVPISIAALAGMVADVFGTTVRMNDEPQPHLRGRAGICYVPSTRRARLELGLVETVPLAAALEQTIQWYLKRQ